MGGVDKLDYLISLFQVHAKTKKCPVGVSFNFLAFSLANALIEYWGIYRTYGTLLEIPDLIRFWENFAEFLDKDWVAKKGNLKLVLHEMMQSKLNLQ